MQNVAQQERFKPFKFLDFAVKLEKIVSWSFLLW